MNKAELDKIECKVIKDKTLSRHDALYKLILIGDTCKYTCLSKAKWVQMGLSEWSCKDFDNAIRVNHHSSLRNSIDLYLHYTIDTCHSRYKYSNIIQDNKLLIWS